MTDARQLFEAGRRVLAEQPAAILKPDSALPPEVTALLAVLEGIATRLTAIPATPPPMAAWMPIDQAAEYSGLSEGLLRRLVAARRIAGINDGRTKVKRADLDSFDAALLENLPTRKQLQGARRGDPE